MWASRDGCDLRRRETVYVYGTHNVPDANPTTGESIDLLQVKQKNGASYDLLATNTKSSLLQTRRGRLGSLA
jgi:hypothetical protein